MTHFFLVDFILGMHINWGNVLEAMENRQCISLNMHIMTHFLTGFDRRILPSQTALVSVCVAFNLSTIWRTCERFPNHLSKAWPSSIYIWIWSIGMEDGNETNAPQHAMTIVLVPSHDSYCLSSGNEILALGDPFRAVSRFAPSQWETSLQSNAVSHWLGANLESTSQWETSLQSNAVSHWLGANLESWIWFDGPSWLISNMSH